MAIYCTLADDAATASAAAAADAIAIAFMFRLAVRIDKSSVFSVEKRPQCTHTLGN